MAKKPPTCEAPAPKTATASAPPATPEKRPIVDHGGPSSPDGDEVFSVQQLKYIQARSEGRTIKASAAAAKPPIPYRTARRLDDQEAVRAAVRKLARDAVDDGVRSLAQSARAAAKALKEVAEGGGTGDGPRVSAARAVLELSIQALKIDDVLERVEQLEAAQGKGPVGSC